MFEGEGTIGQVHEKKYLGDILSDDMKNQKNLKDKTNKAVGIVNTF